MLISIIGLLAPGRPVCICSSRLHQLTNQIQASKVSKNESFFIRYSLLADPHYVPMIDDSSTERVIKRY